MSDKKPPQPPQDTPATDAPPPRRDALRDEEPVQLGNESRSSVIPRVRRRNDAAQGNTGEQAPSGDRPDAEDDRAAPQAGATTGPQGTDFAQSSASFPGGSAPGGFAGQSSPPAFWQGLIARNESIVWFGAPDPALIDKPRGIAGKSRLVQVLCGLGLVLGVGLLLRDGNGGFIEKLLGMGLAVVCAIQIVRGLNPGSKRMHFTQYALTDRAIYIARVRAGEPPSAQRYPLNRNTPVSGNADSVTFVIGMRRRRQEPEVPIMAGFFHITDAPEVLAIVRGLQKGMTQ